MVFKKTNKDLPSHTFLAFKQGNKWYWFEYAFARYRGIHEYTNLNALINDVICKHEDYAIKNKRVLESDLKHLKLFEYDKPNYGCDDQDFINEIINQGKEIKLPLKL